MKIPRLSFGRELQELRKFESLEQVERSIVFYSEDNFSIINFEPILTELTKKLGIQVCYLTSSPNDPMLTTENKKIKAFYIGKGATRTKLFLTLKADVLVMTMPDLETFHIKRSKIYPVHYVHVFHSIVSSHMVYRKGAFDNFDSILCVGNHHIKEIREIERVYGLKPKNLLEHGYGLLDTLIKNYYSSSLRNNYNKKQVLIAPSWGTNALLESHGHEIVKILLNNGYSVIVRPHPVTMKKKSKIINSLKKDFKTNPNFRLETDMRSSNSLQSSQYMISDWSGVALEYAFTFERPVLFVDVPKKINNPEYEKIPSTPVEVSLRNQLGCIISIHDLAKIPEKLDSLSKNLDIFKKQIIQARSQTIFNLGKSGEVGAKYIVQIDNEQKRKMN